MLLSRFKLASYYLQVKLLSLIFKPIYQYTQCSTFHLTSNHWNLTTGVKHQTANGKAMKSTDATVLSLLNTAATVPGC